MTYDAREKSTHDGQPVECYRFAFGATVHRWTSAETEIVLPTGTYAPAVISRSSLEHSQERRSGTLEVRVPRDSAVVAPFMPYLPGIPLALTVYRAHRGDEALAVPIFVGSVSSIAVRGSEAVLTCMPLDDVLGRRVPTLTYQPRCNWPLYGAGCGVDRNLFRDSRTVVTVSGVEVRCSGPARADGWYTNGWLEVRSPAVGAGDIRMIVAHVGDLLTLISPLPGLVAGDPLYAFAGCDRTEAVCVSKFNNFANHLGFPRLPTRNPFGVGSLA